MKKYKTPIFILFSLLIFLLSATVSSAQTLSEYKIDFYAAYSKVVVNEEILFKNPTSGNILVDLPEDAQGISLYIDNNLEKANIENNQLNIELKSTTSARLSYVTKELLERSEFIASLRMPYDVENLGVSFTLPENAVLEKPLPESTVAPSPVYPLPSKVTTDGRQIKLSWEYSNIKKGDEKSFFVRYKGKGGYYMWAIILLAAVIFGLVMFIITRKPKVERVVEKVVEKEDMLEKHLKEDEEQVVNILKQREGQCEQGTLRIITGFSKAKLSGLLKELEERNVIYKEKRGKKNLVFLRKL